MHDEIMGIGLSELSTVNLKPITLEEALVITGQMAVIVIKLDKIIEDLTEKLNLNSNNSSKPPSASFNKKCKHKDKGKSDKNEVLNPDTREHNAKPILLEFKTWLTKKQTQAPPQSPLGKAIFYEEKQLLFCLV